MSEWISFDERVPTSDDGDELDRVWMVCKIGNYVAHLPWNHRRPAERGYTHWMTTGIKRPSPPPKQEGE